MEYKVSKLRIWLFRGLVIMAAGLMLVSWFLPWWAADIPIVIPQTNTVIIHPWALEQHSGPEYPSWTEGVSEMPAFFAPLMWIYLALNLGLIFYGGLRPRGKKGMLALGVAGVGFIAVAVIMIFYTSMRLRGLGSLYIPLIGLTYFDSPLYCYVTSGLKIGHYMAYGVGALLIFLALFRNKIIGKTKINAQSKA